MASSYPMLEDDEQVKLELHRHWVNILPILFSSVILIAVLIVAWTYAGLYADQIDRYVPVGTLYMALLALFVLLVLVLGLSWWVYENNRLILTDRHLVEISQNGLFNRKVSQLSLTRVQDASGQKNGFWQTILGYGDITIETAGEEENFRFRQFPDPYDLAKRIMQAHEAALGSQGQQPAASDQPNGL